MAILLQLDKEGAMRREPFSANKDDLDPRKHRTVSGITRVLLVVGLLAVVGSLVLDAGPLKIVGAVGLCLVLLLCLYSRWPLSQIRAQTVVALCYVAGTAQLLADALTGLGFLLLLGTVGLAGAVLSQRAAAFWCIAAIATTLAGTSLYSLHVLQPASPPSLGAGWWLSWGGTFATLAAVAYLVQQCVVHRLREEAVAEASRQSEEKYRGLVDICPDAIVVSDLTGRTTFVSPQTWKLLAVPEDEGLVGRSTFDYVIAADRPRLAARIESLLAAGKQEHTEYTVLRPNGATVPVELSSVVIRDAPGKPTAFMATIRDISDRKKAEEAMRKSETLYRTLFESANDAILIMNSKEFIDCNLTATRMFGYPREKLVGHSPVEFSPARQADGRESAVVASEKIQAAIDGEPQFFEWTHQRADGSLALTEVSLSCMEPREGPMLMAIVRDVTERRKAEESLRELSQAVAQSERLKTEIIEKLNDAQEVAQIGSWDWDIRRNVVWWSDETYRLFGVSPGEHTPSFASNSQFIHQDDLQRYRGSFAISLETGAPLDLDVRVLAGDGVTRHCKALGRCYRDESGRPVRVVGTLRDVTEHKRAEESLRKLSQAVEQSPVNVAITDVDGNIEYVNARFCQITGYSQAEAIGQNSRILKSGHTSDEEYRALWQTIAAGGEWSGEFLNKAKDGSLFWERALITSIKDENGRITHYLAVKEDITDRKKDEEAMQQMRLQLTHVARLSTLGEMAAELAHELNHPLYAILNYSKASRNLLAEEGVPDLKSLREWNEEIAAIASSAGEVVKRLRSFASRAESPRTVCRIEETVEEALALFAVELRSAQAVVETSFSAGLPAVEIDRVQIQQVIVNLLSNAVDAMADSPRDMRKITVGTSVSDATVEVVVCDRGVGLPPGSETRVFEPFVSTKPEGLGMGLSIARTIVTAHGGRLWATSNPEGGASFHFTLPFEHGGCSHGV
jgi:PAS domain S-box-containing protein